MVSDATLHLRRHRHADRPGDSDDPAGGGHKEPVGCTEGGQRGVAGPIFPNLNEKAGKEVRKEMEFSGPIRMSDVQDLQLRIVQTVRQLQEQATIVPGDPRDAFV